MMLKFINNLKFSYIIALLFVIVLLYYTISYYNCKRNEYERKIKIEQIKQEEQKKRFEFLIKQNLKKQILDKEEEELEKYYTRLKDDKKDEKNPKKDDTCFEDYTYCDY